MSVKAISWAFDQDIKESGYKLVLIALADYANDDNIAYPSFSSLEKKCSSSRTSISRAINFLIEIGLITKVKLSDYVGKKADKRQSCYLLNIGSKTLLVAKRDQYQNATDLGTETLPKLVSKRYSNRNKPSYNRQNNIYVEKSKNTDSISDRISQWKQQAKNEIQPTQGQLEVFEKFITYWTAHNSTDHKFLAEKQKAFIFKQRFATWLGNVKKWNQPSNRQTNFNQQANNTGWDYLDELHKQETIKKFGTDDTGVIGHG
ncbi:helix-turn-helix domain-containing protein [Francisella sp. SYW-9]|uniref:helix-turn-helix domain-containing protein n=1 Tax=Francisella sp. SYW-9 TaxID=2610888 RepID=UPI00123D35FF|nr:helix-turn-helix domain-containing protein [Francisella sp. SYW-9]